MTMDYQYLDKDKNILEKHNGVACFVGAENVYEKKRHRYFAFPFPAKRSLKDKIITKKWISSLKELYNFGEYLPQEAFDWKNHRLIFDLDTTPGHIIFAICTCARYLREQKEHIFGTWTNLSNHKKYKLTTFEKFLFLHYLDKALSDGHGFLYYPQTNFDKFIGYQPPNLQYVKSSYGGCGTKPSANFNLPFSEEPQFRLVGLQQSYTPPCSREDRYGPGDGSFEKALLERTLA